MFPDPSLLPIIFQDQFQKWDGLALAYISDVIQVVHLLTYHLLTYHLKLFIKKEDQITPLESDLEIKTRISHKPFEIQELAPQL